MEERSDSKEHGCCRTFAGAVVMSEAPQEAIAEACEVDSGRPTGIASENISTPTTKRSKDASSSRPRRIMCLPINLSENKIPLGSQEPKGGIRRDYLARTASRRSDAPISAA